MACSHCESTHAQQHEQPNDGGAPVKIIIAAALFLGGIVLPLPKMWELAFFLAAYLIAAMDVLREAGKNILHGEIFDENFLMSLASLGALAIGEYPEAVAVMLLYSIGELLQERALSSSRRSIRALMSVRPDHAWLLENGRATEVPAENVPVAAILLVHPGEKIPLDGTVIEGVSLLDTSALTGEALPQEAGVGDTVLAGCLNETAVLQIRVTKPFGESTASKILELVENAGEKKAQTEQFITRFARIYTPVVVFSAVALALVPPLLGLGSFTEFLHRALSFLVISCPCALVISIPLAFFSGIGRASRSGILFKGGNYLEALGKAEIAAFDKTGTLTRGKFSVVRILPAAGISNEELLHLAACAELHSLHPLAKSIVEAYGSTLDQEGLTERTEEAGHGVAVTANGSRILAGKENYLRANGISFEAVNDSATVIYVAANGKYCGAILLSDTVKADAKEGIAALGKLGVVKTVMLTGDRLAVAEQIGREVGVDCVQAGLMPDEKLTALHALRAELSPKGTLLYAGDGINDAPVLAGADIGIAMGGLGSDAAMEAADVVIMSDEPSKIALGIQISRKTMKIAKQNIVFAIAVKLIILTVSIALPIPLWLAVFADVGVCILAIFNTLRVLRL